MNLERFRHFVAVIEEGSFSKAAVRVGIQQAPLSQSIARLERDLGARLMKRNARGVELTSAGGAFLAEAKVAIDAAERAISLARASVGGRRPVQIGVVSVGMWQELPRLIAAARDLDIPVRLHQLATGEQITALAQGRLDLGLVAPPVDLPVRMKAILLADEPAVYAVPTSWVRGRRGPVPLERIAAQLIMFPRADGPVLHDAITTMLGARGHPPTIVQESPQMLTTLALVAVGAGAAIVPAVLARHVAVKGVAFQAIEPGRGVPKWPVALAHMPLSARSDAAKMLARWRQVAIGN